MSTAKPPLSLFSLAAASALVLTACAGQEGSESETAASSPSGSHSAAGETSEPTAADDEQREEVMSLSPRVVMTYDGGIMTVDGRTGELINTVQESGFLRLSHAGDGRHVVVSDGDEFTIFDSGLIEQEHGDHSHYYEQAPQFTGGVLEAPEAGHVVVNAGRTALFADGSGQIAVAQSEAFDDGQLEDSEYASSSTDDAHHGVAVPLSSGGLLVTEGTEESRDTVRVLDADGAVVAETQDCPGVHGEAVAQPTESGDVVTLGCENGPVVYRDGAFHKVSVPEEYQRSGNQFGSAVSPVVLTDYKVDEDAELERPTRIGLLDTRTDAMTTVELDSAYWFRSLARGADGEAVVLTYDGELNILDPETGEILHEVAVVEPWEENEQWQQPGPAVQVSGDYAYVTDAAQQTLHAVDITNGEVVDSWELPETPNEFVVVTGESPQD